MACTMGWVQSPPTFCTMSETVCDLANQARREPAHLSRPHRLEEQASIADGLSRSLTPTPREPDTLAADADLARTAGVPLGDPSPAEERAPPSNCKIDACDMVERLLRLLEL